MVSAIDNVVLLASNNPGEDVEDKVLKNRLAQKKFREKKQQKYKELMERVGYLEKMNKELKNNESMLKQQIENLKKNSGGSSFGSSSAIDTGSSRGYNYSEDGLSLSGTSVKGSEDLSQVHSKFDLNRNPSIDAGNSFSFPWGSLEPKNSQHVKTGSIGSINTLFSDKLSGNSSLKADNLEYNFGETADENVFCDNLGNACPYTPSDVKQNIGKTLLKTPLDISADLLDANKTVKKESDIVNDNGRSNLNNIDSVFGIPNFSFSPSAYESAKGLETQEQSLEFLTNEPEFHSNVEDVSLFDIGPSTDFGSGNTDSPMNFNFNYLLDNTIDNTNQQSITSKYASDAQKKKEFFERGKRLMEEDQANEDDDLVVPSDGKLFTCTEIWDRINANPKLTDIDLDNLCMELKSKAKCSEGGVLIREEDLNNALKQHQA